MKKVVLKLKSKDDVYFVDGLFEPIDWTWGSRDQATRYTAEALSKRAKITPFDSYIKMSTLEIVEID